MGYADPCLKEMGSYPLRQSVKKSTAETRLQAGSPLVTPKQGGGEMEDLENAPWAESILSITCSSPVA